MDAHCRRRTQIARNVLFSMIMDLHHRTPADMPRRPWMIGWWARSDSNSLEFSAFLRPPLLSKRRVPRNVPRYCSCFPPTFTVAIIGASDDRIDCFNNFFYCRGDKIKIGSRDRPRLTQQIGLKVAFMRYLIPTGNNQRQLMLNRLCFICLG